MATPPKASHRDRDIGLAAIARALPLTPPTVDTLDEQESDSLRSWRRAPLVSRSSAYTPSRHSSLDGDIEQTPSQMTEVFQFIRDLGAGMIKFESVLDKLESVMDACQIRLDKFESVLDHLEIDGLHHAEGIKELKDVVGQCQQRLITLDDMPDRVGRCEREQQRLTGLLEQRRSELVDAETANFEKAYQELKDVVGQCQGRLVELDDMPDRMGRCEREQQYLTELLEQRSSELLVAAAADAEKACQDYFLRSWAESGVAEVKKTCEEAFARLRVDLGVMLEQGLPPAKQASLSEIDDFGVDEISALSLRVQEPKPSPLCLTRRSHGAGQRGRRQYDGDSRMMRHEGDEDEGNEYEGDGAKDIMRETSLAVALDIADTKFQNFIARQNEGFDNPAAAKAIL